MIGSPKYAHLFRSSHAGTTNAPMKGYAREASINTKKPIPTLRTILTLRAIAPTNTAQRRPEISEQPIRRPFAPSPTSFSLILIVRLLKEAERY
jgi:hypothetical protein